MNTALQAFPRVMGIVNINDDSFCGDGTLDVEQALRQSAQMASDGADFIDVGAESARTNREAISEEEEIARLLPFIDSFATVCEELQPRDEFQLWPPLLSINTWRPKVVEAVLKTGAIGLINDIGGLVDDTNARLCFEYDCSLLIMHTVGLPKVPHFHQRYENLWTTVEDFFEDRIERARKIGLGDDKIVIDPGIDFAKQCEDNLSIFASLGRLQKFGLPVLLPVSRKTVIGDVLGIEDPSERDAGTIACLVKGLAAGANYFRVHNVKAVADCVRVIAAIQKAPAHMGG